MLNNMKKFSFRLESVLRVRKIEEDLAKAELIAKNSAVDSARRELEERKAAYETTSTQNTKSAIVTVSDVMAARNRAELSGQRLIAAEAALHEARNAAQVARVGYADAAAKTKAIGKLRETAFEEFQALALRDEQNELDDLASTRKLLSSGAA